MEPDRRGFDPGVFNFGSRISLYAIKEETLDSKTRLDGIIQVKMK